MATGVSGTITTQRSSGVQALRAIAALFVVVQHAVYWASLSADVDAHYIMKWGDIGVAAFFVISGYVMVMCLPQGRMFMVWRVARIYPGFWAAVLLSAVVYSLTGRHWQLDWYSLSLLPTQYMNGDYGIPYWTLIYELVFYVIMYIAAFSVVLFDRTRQYFTHRYHLFTKMASSWIMDCCFASESDVHCRGVVRARWSALAAKVACCCYFTDWAFTFCFR